MPDKVRWRGTVLGVQPRIRLTRSYDERSHTYLGYTLEMRGALGKDARDFAVAVGPAAHAKHAFLPGEIVAGIGDIGADPRLNLEDVYKVSGLNVIERPPVADTTGPPWHTLAPPLTTYRERGHRRLAEARYAESCSTCVWGCRMAVEIITDQWKPHLRSHRQETFCYGPLSCPLYAPGPVRRVRGRKGMVYVEEDWVDQEEVAGRRNDPDS